MFPVDQKLVRQLFGQRDPWSHKGQFGRVLVIGGSRRYTGAPVLNALAALRCGADLTTVFAPRRAADIAASFSPDLIAEPANTDYLTPLQLKDALALAEGKSAVVIGGGLEQKPATLQFIRSFIQKCPLPTVLDDDALHAVGKEKLRTTHLLTPQAHEFFVLSGTQLDTDVPKRIAAAEALARERTCTVLLKGNTDIITNGEKTATNKTGNPFMTKGGNGCILAGAAAGLLARGIPPLEAGGAAAYLVGAAGDLAAKRLGPGTLASDVLSSLPDVIQRL